MSVDTLTPLFAVQKVCPRQGTPSLPLARWIGLAVLLVAEIVLVTLRFDTATLGDDTGWWAVLLRQSSRLLQLVITVVTATVLVGGGAMWNELRRSHERLDKSPCWWPWLLSHGVAYTAFFSLTALVLEGELARSACPSAWFLLWLATGGLTLTLAARAALPGPLWLTLALRQNLRKRKNRP